MTACMANVRKSVIFRVEAYETATGTTEDLKCRFNTVGVTSYREV